MNLSLLDFIHAITFSANKHKNQRRKGSLNIPYVNHPLEVTDLLASTVGTNDLTLLTAAVLHDTLEDTKTLPEEIKNYFGSKVLNIVLEVTDDMKLSKKVRKKLQVENAKKLSKYAKLIRIADKTCNVLDMLRTKYHWTKSQKKDYVAWSVRVFEECSGENDKLDTAFRNAIESAKEVLRS